MRWFRSSRSFLRSASETFSAVWRAFSFPPALASANPRCVGNFPHLGIFHAAASDPLVRYHPGMKSLGAVVFNGTTYGSLTEAAVAAGMDPGTAHGRVRRGWSVADALSTPPTSPARPVRIGEVTYATKAEACAAAGVDPWTMHHRVKHGMTIAEALAIGKRPRGRRPSPVREAAVAAGADPKIVTSRVRTGWTLQRALAVTPRRYRPRQQRAQAAPPPG
jgi:hypothetical protein